MSVALVLVLIAAFLVFVGVVLAIVGIFMDGEARRQRRAAAPEAEPSLLDMLIELMKKCFTILLDSKSSRGRRLTALGMMFVMLGLAFLLSAGIAALVGSGGGGGGGGSPSPTPTPTATPS